jgi:hypothetical protein
MSRKSKAALVVVSILALGAISVPGAGAAQFTSTGGKYPVSLTGSSTADVFDAFGSQVKCTNNTFTASLAAPSEEINEVASFSNCTAFGLPATVTFECCFKKRSDGTIVIAAVVIHIYASTPHGSPICTVTVPKQGPLGKVTYTNNANGTVTVSGTVGGITATQVRNSIFCPAGTHTTSAAYTIQPGGIVMSGKVGGVAEGIHVK